MRKVYLDNAATTPLSEEVFEAMKPYLMENFGNPSSTHTFGRTAKAAIETARKNIAKHLNCKGSEIFFTSGGTESNNTALKCAFKEYNVKRIITTPIEHKCVYNSVQDLNICDTVTVEYVKIIKNGHVDYKHLEELLQNSKETTLVSIMHANNEVGTINDVKKIGTLCKEYSAYFHSDTVQTVAHYPIDLQAINIDFMSGAAHKFHGPKGSGFLFIRSNNFLKPLIHGGGQERNMRAGTENVAGIVGLSKAMDFAYENLEEDRNHIQSLKYYMKVQLEENFKGICFNGDTSENSLFTVLNTTLPNSNKTHMILLTLDIMGIAVSGGSACNSGATKNSHVLEALPNLCEGKAIRFSFSKYNTKDEIDYVIDKLKTLVEPELVKEMV